MEILHNTIISHIKRGLQVVASVFRLASELIFISSSILPFPQTYKIHISLRHLIFCPLYSTRVLITIESSLPSQCVSTVTPRDLGLPWEKHLDKNDFFHRQPSCMVTVLFRVCGSARRTAEGGKKRRRNE